MICDYLKLAFYHVVGMMDLCVWSVFSRSKLCFKFIVTRKGDTGYIDYPKISELEFDHFHHSISITHGYNSYGD